MKQGKPDPECFFVAYTKLGLEPSSCLVIEDAESGVKGAKQIGMKVIAVPSKYTNTHNFKKADTICSSLDQITLDLIHSL